MQCNNTDIFLHDVSSFLSRYVDKTYYVFDVVHELNATTSALVTRFHDPYVEYAIDVYLRPVLRHRS